MIEVKDVQYLYRTGQSSAELAAAADEGSTLYILASPGTTVASTILESGATIGVVDVTAGTVTEAMTGSSLLEGIIDLPGGAALF